MANPHETVRQDVEQKAPDVLVCFKGHDLDRVVDGEEC